jgi:hypothetical protein
MWFNFIQWLPSIVRPEIDKHIFGKNHQKYIAVQFDESIYQFPRWYCLSTYTIGTYVERYC